MSLSSSETVTALQRVQELNSTPYSLQNSNRVNLKRVSANGDADTSFEPNHKQIHYENGDNPSMATMNAYGLAGMPPPMMQQQGNPMNMTADAVEVLEVPNNTVGLIIGRGGEQIQTIQSTCGCRVQMAPDTDSNGITRQCTLSGNPQAMSRAKEMIMDIIARAGQRQMQNQQHQGGGMGGGFFNGGGQGEGGGIGGAVFDMQIPGNRVGLVIGKGGEMIKSLQERSGVKMTMVQESAAPGAGPKMLRIQGDADKIEHAKSLVTDVINSGRDGAPGPTAGLSSPSMFNNGSGMGGGGGQRSFMSAPQMMYSGGGGGGGGMNIGEVIVPRSSVGMIIGKGGENIKRMAMESGAKIQFKPDEDQNGSERTAVIQGSLDSIQRATHLITQCVTKSADGGVQDTFYMHIPSSKTGLVIGRGGETIKSINSESGAHVELSRDSQNNPTEKVFVIKGTPYQIHVATHLMRIKVGDIPQGTPVPTMVNAGGMDSSASANIGQMAFQSAYQQPAAAAAGQWGSTPSAGSTYGAAGGAGAGGTDAWSQYYAQQQQQPNAYGGAQAAGGYQQPAGAPAGGTPAAAPAQGAGGQPDYSQQWIEYYRSMGMFEQAALIESQARQQRGQPGAVGGAQQPAPQQQFAQPNYGGGQAAQAYQPQQQHYQQQYHH